MPGSFTSKTSGAQSSVGGVHDEDDPVARHPEYHDLSGQSFTKVYRWLCVNAEIASRLSGAYKRDWFPSKLHRMIEECTTSTFASDVIHWQPHGRAFMICNRDRLVGEVLWQYFDNRCKFTSFQRQLHHYGFLRLTGEGLDRGAYYHALFLRGRPDLSKLMIPIWRKKGMPARHVYDPQSEPNLNAFVSLSPPRQLTACDTGRNARCPALESTQLSTHAQTSVQLDPSGAQRNVPAEDPEKIGTRRIHQVTGPQAAEFAPRESNYAGRIPVAALVPLQSPRVATAQTAVQSYSPPRMLIDHDERVSVIPILLPDRPTGWRFDSSNVADQSHSHYAWEQPTIHQVAFPALQHSPQASNAATTIEGGFVGMSVNHHEQCMPRMDHEHSTLENASNLVQPLDFSYECDSLC